MYIALPRLVASSTKASPIHSPSESYNSNAIDLLARRNYIKTMMPGKSRKLNVVGCAIDTSFAASVTAITTFRLMQPR